MGKKVNLSRIPKFSAGTLVKCACNNYSAIGVIVEAIGSVNYTVKFDERSFITCPESDIRPLTFKEFVWYSDPNTGRLKIGKNSAIPVLLSLVMALVFIGITFTIDEPGLWKFAPMVIGFAIIAVNYLGLRYNYTGKWV